MLSKFGEFFASIWNPINAWGEIDHERLVLAVVRVMILSVAITVISVALRILGV